jgi:hypothetical protein
LITCHTLTGQLTSVFATEALPLLESVVAAPKG